MRAGLPWWLSGKESACQCRRHGFSPWSGKIPHATEQLSPHTTTIEPVPWSLGAHVLQLLSSCATTTELLPLLSWHTLEPVLPNKKGHHNKKPTHSNKE